MHGEERDGKPQAFAEGASPCATGGELLFAVGGGGCAGASWGGMVVMQPGEEVVPVAGAGEFF